MNGSNNSSIFWVEVDRIQPNPYQPRRVFDEGKLSELAESIRQYGVLQPLVVTRIEMTKEDGGLAVQYELIAGERRLRASRIAGLSQVPVMIRTGEDGNRMKLEIAIIENLQREDLNAIDRARAFERLVNEFDFKHGEVAQKIGKSREYVSNSIRLLALPEEMQVALAQGEITEGHTRPILMLADRPEEQKTLFKEVLHKKLTVRDAEAIARRIAHDRVRKKERVYDPEIIELEQKLTDTLGTRVQIESREVGGKIVIDFFSNEDLRNLLKTLQNENDQKGIQSDSSSAGEAVTEGTEDSRALGEDRGETQEEIKEGKEEEDTDLYSIGNFSI